MAQTKEMSMSQMEPMREIAAFSLEVEQLVVDVETKNDLPDTELLITVIFAIFQKGFANS